MAFSRSRAGPRQSGYRLPRLVETNHRPKRMSDRRVASPGKIFFFRPILFPNDCFGAVLNITEAATFSSKPTKSHAARPTAPLHAGRKTSFSVEIKVMTSVSRPLTRNKPLFSLTFDEVRSCCVRHSRAATAARDGKVGRALCNRSRNRNAQGGRVRCRVWVEA